MLQLSIYYWKLHKTFCVINCTTLQYDIRFCGILLTPDFIPVVSETQILLIPRAKPKFGFKKRTIRHSSIASRRFQRNCGTRGEMQTWFPELKVSTAADSDHAVGNEPPRIAVNFDGRQFRRQIVLLLLRKIVI